MEKNTIWAIVLSTLVIVVFSFIQINSIQQVPVTENVTAESTAEIVNTPVVVAAEQASEIDATSLPDVKEEEIVITTDLISVTLTNKGGDVISYKLLEHKDGDNYVNMVDNVSETNRAFSIALGNENNPIINELFYVEKKDANTVRFSRPYTLKNADGSVSNFTLIKQYTFMPGEYVFMLDVYIKGSDSMTGLNINNTAYTLRSSPQIGPYYDKKRDRYENRTFQSFTGEKSKTQTLSDGQTKDYTDSFTWTGVTGKYFALLVSPVSPVSSSSIISKAVYSTKEEITDYANAQNMLVRVPVLQNSVQDTYYIYAGPRTESSLKRYNNAAENGWSIANMKFDYSLQSSGILSWLEIALKWIMGIVYKLIPNYGVSILIMTLLLRLALFPLTKKSSVSTIKMQEIQPKMKEIQEKYKDNKEKLNMEMAKFYKEAGYNPLMGCLPLLIQFPIIIAMFNLFNNYFEFRGAMFIPGWIPDLSVGDSVYTLGFNLPLLGNQIRILPLIYLASQFIQGMITNAANPGAQGKSMKITFYIMYVVFFFMFYNAPAGLLLYWTFSNILMMGQQVIINNMMKKKRAELEAAKANERPVFIPNKKKK
ncbi:MAG: membrane protein insertase YidC [Spirochaetaceae bacterium]|nr:membrane protein insertase YidC [Spirochaetaceae bacterium]